MFGITNSTFSFILYGHSDSGWCLIISNYKFCCASLTSFGDCDSMLIANASISEIVYVIHDMEGWFIKTRINYWQEGKVSWDKLIGGSIRVRVVPYFLTLCSWLSHPVSSVNITDQLHSCVQARSCSQSKWSQHAFCRYNIPNPTSCLFIFTLR